MSKADGSTASPARRGGSKRRAGRGGTAAGRAFAFPKSLRLRKPAEIDPVFRAGRYHRLGWLQARTQPNGHPVSRFMISVSRRAGSAPLRNRIKRVLREAIRLQRHRLGTPHDVCLFITSRPQRPIRLADVERDLLRLFGRLAPTGDALVSDS